MAISSAEIRPFAEAASRQKSHPLMATQSFASLEEYVVYLMHRKAYETAAKLAAGKSLLDWGCNNGYGMEIMLPCVKSAAGLDVAGHAVASARERLPDLKEDIRLYDGSHFPFVAESFDIVTSFQVIEHVADYHNYLSAIAQSLKVGGTAIFTTPNRKIRLGEGMKPWNPFHAHEFSHEELKDLLSGYFSHVRIAGLRALPVIEAVEKDRCQRQREAAMHPRALSWYWFSRRARRLAVLPRRMKQPEKMDPEKFGRYSTNDFRYVDTDLELALDFMAVCTK